MPNKQLAYPRRQPELTGEDIRLRNWARNATLGRPGSVSAPTTEPQLRSFLATTTGRVRMIGSRMSPGRLLELNGRGGSLLDLQPVHRAVVDHRGHRHVRRGDHLCRRCTTALSARGQMLPSSPGVIASQTLAGALATGTHGQGLRRAPSPTPRS